MFTIRNAVIVALMQVGVIVAGILTAGLCYKFWVATNLAIPFFITIFVNYGVFALVIPLIWITLVLTLRNRTTISDDIKEFAFWSGVLIILALVVFFLYADFAPWLQMGGGMAAEE